MRNALVVLCLMTAPLVCAAQTLNVAIDPPAPLPTQDVHLLVSGTLPQGPVSLFQAAATRTGQVIHVDALLNMGGAAVTTPFSFTVDVGLLPTGTYTLIYSQFVFDPFLGTYAPNATRTITFAVNASTQIEPVPTLSILPLLLLSFIVVIAIRRRLPS